MAIPSRHALRALSRRVPGPSPCPAIARSACASQIRTSSRYSNPTKRSFTAAPPTTPSSFTDPVVEVQTSTRRPAEAEIIDEQRAWEQKRQYHLNRMRYAGMGLLLSLVATGAIIYTIDLEDLEKSTQQKKEKKSSEGSNSYKLDASSEANASFQGKEVHVIGMGEGKRIVAQGSSGAEVELVETGTSSVPHFPRTIYLPASSDQSRILNAVDAPVIPGSSENQEEYTLVGLGIRTVMWIQVYVVGLYIRTQDISALQERLIHTVNPIASTLVPDEKASLSKKLLDPKESREIWSKLLEVPGLKTAWRVSPTRNTDFGHLRDGFVTGINKRSQEARKFEAVDGQESQYDSEDFGRSVQEFKTIFAGGKAPKGSLLIMRRDTNGAMDVLYQARPGARGEDSKFERLGSVADERIARLIWLGYLGGEKVSSEAARKGVVEGCVGFASRPVGSVETMVT